MKPWSSSANEVSHTVGDCGSTPIASSLPSPVLNMPAARKSSKIEVTAKNRCKLMRRPPRKIAQPSAAAVARPRRAPAALAQPDGEVA